MIGVGVGFDVPIVKKTHYASGGSALHSFGGSGSSSLKFGATGTGAIGPLKGSGTASFKVQATAGSSAIGPFRGSGTATNADLPTLSSISIPIANTLGGTAFTLTGTNLGSATALTYGGVACTSVVVVNATTITGVTPAKAAGTYNFVVTNPAGTASLSLEAWYPTQITNVWAVHDSEVGVTSSSGSVSQWNDQTSNNLPFLQATAAKKPVYTANVFGSRHSLHFTQTGVVTTTSCMSTAAKKVFASGLSYFAVAKWTSTDTVSNGFAGNPPLGIVSDNGGTVYNMWGASGGQLEYVQYASGYNHVDRGSGLNDGVARLIGVTHVQATGVITQYVGTAAQGSTATFAYQTAFDGYNTLGAGYQNNDGFDGDIGLLVTVNGVISGADLTKLNSWCQAVYGTT